MDMYARVYPWRGKGVGGASDGRKGRTVGEVRSIGTLQWLPHYLFSPLSPSVPVPSPPFRPGETKTQKYQSLLYGPRPLQSIGDGGGEGPVGLPLPRLLHRAGVRSPPSESPPVGSVGGGDEAIGSRDWSKGWFRAR